MLMIKTPNHGYSCKVTSSQVWKIVSGAVINISKFFSDRRALHGLRGFSVKMFRQTLLKAMKDLVLYLEKKGGVRMASFPENCNCAIYKRTKPITQGSSRNGCKWETEESMTVTISIQMLWNHKIKTWIYLEKILSKQLYPLLRRHLIHNTNSSGKICSTIER